jgi:hypothetical protein
VIAGRKKEWEMGRMIINENFWKSGYQIVLTSC